MINKQRTVSPAIRGALYYTIIFGVVGAYFAYVNVMYIERGLNGVQIGIINAASSIVMLISSPLFSALADHKGWHLPILFLGNLFFGASLVGLHFFTDFIGMIIFVSLGAAFSAPVLPLSEMMVIKMVNKYELNFGRIRIWGSIGFFVIGTVMGKVWDMIGLQNLFLVSGVLFALRGFSVLFLEPIGAAEHEEHHLDADGNPQTNPLKIILKDRFFLVFLLGCMLWSASWSTYFNYSTIYMSQLGGTSLLVGLMMSISALGEVPSTFLADTIMRRIGHLRVFIASIFAVLLVIFAVSRLNNPTAVVIVNGFRGLGFGLFSVSGVRFVDKYAPPRFSGTYQSIFSLVNFTVPNLIAMPLMGYLFDNFSIQHVFTTQIILGLLAIGIFVSMLSKSSAKETAAA